MKFRTTITTTFRFLLLSLVIFQTGASKDVPAERGFQEEPTLSYTKELPAHRVIPKARPLSSTKNLAGDQEFPESSPLTSAKGVSANRVFPEARTLTSSQSFLAAAQYAQMVRQGFQHNENSAPYKELHKILLDLKHTFETFLHFLSPLNDAFALDEVQNGAALRDMYREGIRDALLDSIRVLEERGDVSARCVNDTARFIIDLIQGERWALLFLDATGKPSAGISDVKINYVGDYSLCRGIVAPATNNSEGFRGSYCTLKAAVNNPMGNSVLAPKVQLGACLPSTCNETENTLYLAALFDALSVNSSVLRVVQAEIHTDHREATTATRLAIVVIAALVCLMLAGTLYDVVCVQWPMRRAHQAESDKPILNGSSEQHHLANSQGVQTTVDVTPITDDDPLIQNECEIVQKHDSTFTQTILAFSVYTNASKLLDTGQASSSISCLHGIRFLSITWVILGHFLLFGIPYTGNFYSEYQMLLQRWTFTAVTNSFLAVDTFFLLRTFITDFYMAPWCRIGPFVVGILTGFILAESPRRKLRISRTVAVIGWVVATATALAALYGLESDFINKGRNLTLPAAAVYNMFARNAWAVSVAWVILACVSGWGGIVNTFLSWPPFVVLGKLTYMAYLIHPNLIFIFYEGRQTTYSLETVNLAVTFMGLLVAVFGISFVCALALESPMVRLEKAFLSKRKD
ncbi:hypothetical protein EGW08_023063 [Elysia chlorotica]|uniref:Nose resistant-to-fluoxetine protein N-terminal domain-containing protein n=1 Tax=Elysia chlorotica TaxID=188477 RepID=A0A3S0ZJZ0_ELYCH|nr:hypothetical protein EGW08_023063 [Elysia chlorotica]